MKIFNCNLINFKSNKPPLFSQMNDSGLGMGNPLRELEKDMFLKSSSVNVDELSVENVDETAFSLVFGNDKDIDSRFATIWKVNYMLSLYFEFAWEQRDVIRKEKIDKDKLDFSVLSPASPKTRKEVLNFLEKAEVKTISDVLEMGQVYNQINNKKPQSLMTSGLDFLYACALLGDNKTQLPNFLNIALQGSHDSLYLRKEHNLYDYVLFANELGSRSENAFFKKFSHFAPDFNNFEEPEDKLAAFEYIYKTFAIKEFAIINLADNYPEFGKMSSTELYSSYCDIIDYLYENEPSNWIEKINQIFSQTTAQPKISPQALEAFSPTIDTKTPKGKIELYDLLHYEKISISELNQLIKSSQYADVEPLNIILNKNSIVEALAETQDFEKESAEEFYFNFNQTLNAIFNEKGLFDDEGLKTLLNIIKTFGIKNDKEFLAFWQNVEQSYIKQGKNKKQQVSKKPKKENIKEFIELFGFLNEDMVQKFKKDKNYPIKSELLKRKAQFDKIKPELGKQIAKQNASHLLISPKETFIKYESLLKINPNIEAFVQKVAETKTKENALKTEVGKARYEFLTYFKDEKLLDEFLSKNNIVIDETKESKAIYSTILRILGAIFDFKSEEEKQNSLNKLMKNDFLSNTGSAIVKFARNKDDMELEILFGIILDENINSIAQINTILNKYKGKDGNVAGFLMNFQNYNFTFKEYVKRLENIQKEFDNAGIPITINSDNIFDIDLDEYGEGKIQDSKLAILAKEILNPYNDGNFICGLKNAFVEVERFSGKGKIGKEIISAQNGRYAEEYSNIIKQFHLSLDEINPNNEPNIHFNWQEIIEDDFAIFLNSKEWLEVGNNKEFANLTLHAKLRLIDRFILDKKDKTQLYHDKTKVELREILRIVYYETPTKLYKSQDGDGRFVAFFDYQDTEIKAVFSNSGQLLTIIKR